MNGGEETNLWSNELYADLLTRDKELLEEYLTWEKAIQVAAEYGILDDSPVVELARSRMDKIWYRMSDKAHEYLDSRGDLSKKSPS